MDMETTIWWIIAIILLLYQTRESVVIRRDYLIVLLESDLQYHDQIKHALFIASKVIAVMLFLGSVLVLNWTGLSFPVLAVMALLAFVMLLEGVISLLLWSLVIHVIFPMMFGTTLLGDSEKRDVRNIF